MQIEASLQRLKGLAIVWLVAVASMTSMMAAGAAHAQSEAQDSSRVLANLRSTYKGTQFDSVRATPLTGIFEVVMGQKVAYTDTSGRYFMFGNLLDLQTQANLTEERLSEVNKVDPANLPLDQALKTVKGNGSRVLYVFADPECGYCKQLEKTLLHAENVTVYTFLYPVLGPRSQANAESIWCAKDREAAFAGHMLGTGSVLPASCDNPLAKNMRLGQSMGITGTPTIISASGRKIPGAMPIERINALLAESQQTVSRAK